MNRRIEPQRLGVDAAGRNHSGSVLARLVMALATPLVASAWAQAGATPQPATWDGDSAAGIAGDGSTWHDANNWTTGGVIDSAPSNVAPGDDLTFGGGTVGQINLGGNQVANSLTFTAGFTLDAPGSTNTLSLASGVINVSPGVSATINADLTSSMGLALMGSGTLTLGGNNAYNGTTTVYGGALIIAGTSALPSGNAITASSAELRINANATISGSLNNSGAFTVNAPTTVANGITNTGTVTVAAGKTLSSGDFTQSSGALAINGAMQLDGGTFYDNGGAISGAVTLVANSNSPTVSFGSSPASGGTFNFIGNTTTSNLFASYLQGSGIPAGVTVNVDPSYTAGITFFNILLPAGGTFTNAGTLNLLATGQNHNINLSSTSASTLDNTGMLNVNPDPTGDGGRVLKVYLNNSGSLNINASTLDYLPITNTGTITVAAGKTLTSSDFIQESGTLTINGSLQGATFQDNGGTISGTVTLADSSTLSFGSIPASGGTFNFVGGTGSSASAIQSSTIPAGVTINAAPSYASGVTTFTLNLPGGGLFTNVGALNLLATGQNHNIILNNNGNTLANVGTLSVNPGPTADGQRSLMLNLNNSGTFSVNASVLVTGGIINTGTVTIAANKTLSSSSFAQLSGALTINGALQLDSSTFYDDGGAISGVVKLTANSNSPTVSFGSAPAARGTFNFLGSTTSSNTYGSYVQGSSIPVGVTVNAEPSFVGGITNFTLNLIGDTFTNAGTLNLLALSQNHNITLYCNSTLFNTGMLNVNPGPTADGARLLQLSLNNSGAFNVNASTTVANSIINSGTVTIAAGKTLSLGSATFTQTAGTTVVAAGATLASGAVSVGGGSALNLNGTLSASSLTVGETTDSAGGSVHVGANPGTGILARSWGALTINTGGSVDLADAASHANRTVLVINGALSNSGTLDLGGNDLLVKNGNLSAITSQLASGFNHGSGYWNGAGIRSSAAANDSSYLTTLGVVQATGAGTFDGQTVAAGDVEVKYTYYGDADLSGQVDGTDYSLIDHAFTADQANPGSVTGWQNGDFNYDGKIDGSDYSLIDNAFNMQGTHGLASPMNMLTVPTAELASFAGRIGPAQAVPEPVAVPILLALGGFVLLPRKRRMGT